MKTYAEKLKDSRWLKKKSEVCEAHGWKCVLCASQSDGLEVHHPQYIPGREPWEYDNLVPLCPRCHSRHHNISAPYKDPFRRIVKRDARNGNRDAMALLSLFSANT